MERQDETQFTTKIDHFLSFIPPLNANVLFCRFSFNLTLCMTKLRVLVPCWITLLSWGLCKVYMKLVLNLHLEFS